MSYNVNNYRAKQKFDVNRHSFDKLNDLFKRLTPEERLINLYQLYDVDEVLFTSSFGINSSYLLYLVSKVNPRQKVHFINTGFLFEETLKYKKELAYRLNLDIVGVDPSAEEHELTKSDRWWEEHPKMCCAINKIAPLERLKKKRKIWISGVLAYQTKFRSNLGIFAAQGNIIKFHPLIDMEEGDLRYQMSYNKLLPHPLENSGYGSIGCTHCTLKGQGRSGRWANSAKTECGLHTNYFKQREK